MASALTSPASAVGSSGRAVSLPRADHVRDAMRKLDLFVVSETAAGFGRACRDTLTGSRWTPPLDRDGHAVTTVIHYTCRFEVR